MKAAPHLRLVVDRAATSDADRYEEYRCSKIELDRARARGEPFDHLHKRAHRKLLAFSPELAAIYPTPKDWGLN